MAVAGESVGGNMAAALTLMAKQRGDVTFVQTSMYYPVTDAAMDTASYDEFAEGYYLTRKAMEWFWDAYTTDPAQRAEITASPNQATIEQLAGLPPTLLLVDEVDLLRDEGEAYAAKLRAAGVAVTTVRYDGVVHDFMLLNAMSEAHATRAAIAQATAFLRAAFGRSQNAMSPDATRNPAATTSPARSSAPRSSTPHRRSPAARSSRCSPRSRPGCESGWHQHPGEEVGYILAGTVRMEIDGRPDPHAARRRRIPDPARDAAQRDRPWPRRPAGCSRPTSSSRENRSRPSPSHDRAGTQSGFRWSLCWP